MTSQPLVAKTRRLAAVCAAISLIAPLGAAAAGIVNLDLSGQAPGLAAAVPVIAVAPGSERRVAVVWRFIAPAAKPNEDLPGDWQCHVSLSSDGGASFHDQAVDWDRSLTRCNAPYVAISAKGEIYAGATLSSAAPPAEPGGHRVSAAVVVKAREDGARDGGSSWSPAVAPIASGMRDRFEGAAFLPEQALDAPWDGARGVVDPQTGAVYISGAFPAPPGGKARSQRFFSVSTDGGRAFGPIRPFAAPDWPERWDGDIAAAHGLLGLSYLGEGAPDASVKCLCAIFGLSSDGGATVRRSLVAAGDIGVDTLVHYPELAADPSRKGRFGVALISANGKRVSALVTADAGATWRSASPVQPADVATVSRPAVAFTPGGVLVLAWRGYHPDGSYDLYAAARDRAGDFGAATRVSTQSSTLPDALKATYALRGDFHTALAASAHWVHVAWADARTGQDLRVVYARLPLSLLTSASGSPGAAAR